jgi:aminoglycoside phosphotransferase (APT) family kinase protein
MQRIAMAWVETLAELHEVDYRAAGLGELGRPEGYVGRQIAGWTKRYQRAATEDVPALDRTAAWLADHLPREVEPALIHNDFKYDNVVLDPSRWERIRAVLDWEMATIGDPLMDLGTALGYWVDPDDPPAMLALNLNPTTLEGNPGRAEIATRYSAITGLDLGDVVFYYAFGLFKIAVIVQQIYYRYHHGFTSDERFASFGMAAAMLGDFAQEAIGRGTV